MAREKYTIAENYTLPSHGLIYGEAFDPDIKLRSMTAEDEMRRLTATETPYKVLCGIIEDCIVGEKPPVSVYDMCLGDYQFLLHRLRVVTYGSDYKMQVQCPVCGGISEQICDLDKLEVIEYNPEEYDSLKMIKLSDGKEVELRFQTPRILDGISKRKKELLAKNPAMLTDPGFLLTLMSFIKTIDGQVLDQMALERYVRNMPMRDANKLMQQAVKLNESIGLNTEFNCTCSHCNFEMNSTFRITSEFFGHTID